VAHLLHRAFHALHREVISNSTDEYPSPHVALATTDGIALIFPDQPRARTHGKTLARSVGQRSQCKSRNVHPSPPPLMAMVYLCTALALAHCCTPAPSAERTATANRTWLGMQRVLPRMWSEPHEHAARTSSIGISEAKCSPRATSHRGDQPFAAC
jgi:hypothetical protein